MIYLFKTAWKYAGKDRWKVILFYILHSISLGGELLKPYAFGRAINELQANGIDNLQPTMMWLFIYVGGFFQFEIFHRIAQYFVISTALRNQQRFINNMYKRVYNLSIKWHVDHHSGEVVNRINVAALALRDFSFEQRCYLEYIYLSIGPIIILMGLSWQIALISIVLTVINLIVVEKMNRVIQPILNKKNEYQHSYSARLIDFVSNIRTVISLRLGKRTNKELDKLFNKYYKEFMNENKINQPRCFMISFGLIITELVVITYYLWSHKVGHIPIMVGSLIMIVNYFRKMSDAFFKITSSFYDTLHWKVSLKSVNPIINAMNKNLNKDIYKKDLSNWKHISIKEMNFQYNKGETTLSDINLDILKKSKIAIVGTSGSGKSTLLNLLAGLYKPGNVKLTIDGRKYSNLDLITNTSLLTSQDSEVFENTIIYNITFGLDYDLDEIKKVIDMAQLNEVIERLPDGFNSDIREKGVNLSGGEKQRIALARGLFFSKQKSILLLDEVTSSVDALNERLIYQKIMDNYKYKSIICTVHRLHLLKMFDTILVMDKGNIVEKGNFKYLLNKEGLFKRMWEKYRIDENA
ncbi:MAG: ABC transporter ATP-binding protein [Firmicutes bacterium]|nr:ABC transporter ATP-binding protein [Bacillota bacterium]